MDTSGTWRVAVSELSADSGYRTEKMQRHSNSKKVKTEHELFDELFVEYRPDRSTKLVEVIVFRACLSKYGQFQV